MKFLLIDDDPFALKLLAHQLQRLGHTSLVLFDKAHEAVAYIAAHVESVEMIFCDLRMPDFDGIEFIRHLESIRYGGGLVLISGEDDRVRQTAEKLALAYHIDLIGTLAKPVIPDQLRQLLDRGPSPRTVQRRRAERPSFGAEELRDAIQHRDLVNFYQPKVDLVTGELLGVEALVRWRHRRFGIVFPDQFITVAEEGDLITELTWLVMEMAFQQCRAWSQQGLALTMCVNVSMDSLVTIDFPETVMRLAQDAGIDPSSVVLEVTESRLMKNFRNTLDVLTRLRLHRVSLAIDDFGTGNSSLIQLRDVPFNELKLDRSFVHGATTDPGLRAIVDGTLTMARGLGMKSVAEGVEDIADWSLMRDVGCNMAQGYFIARPMLANDLPGWLGQWNAGRADLLAAAP
jgi:EAL domain-containing protein (putative c-di-GMP-specific phosphodiesterase class I)/FixJ family two-component response regulator